MPEGYGAGIMTRACWPLAYGLLRPGPGSHHDGGPLRLGPHITDCLQGETRPSLPTHPGIYHDVQGFEEVRIAARSLDRGQAAREDAPIAPFHLAPLSRKR